MWVIKINPCSICSCSKEIWNSSASEYASESSSTSFSIIMRCWTQDLIACSRVVWAEKRWAHCWLRPASSKVMLYMLPLSFHRFCGKSPRKRMRSWTLKPPREYNKSKRDMVEESGIDKLVRFSVYKRSCFPYRIGNLELLFELRGGIGCMEGLPEDSWQCPATLQNYWSSEVVVRSPLGWPDEFDRFERPKMADSRG